MKNEVSGQQQEASSQAQCKAVEVDYINSLLDIASTGNDQHRPSAEIDIVPVIKRPADISIDRHTDILCRTFTVAGLGFALPVSFVESMLTKVKVKSYKGEGMISWTATATADCSAISIIDLKPLIMGTEKETGGFRDAEDGAVNVMLIKGSCLGIVYQQDTGEQRVLPEQVCWRNQSSSRHWLAGTVRQHGLSILDLEGIFNLLGL